jgi:hypothetical protein
MVIGPDHIRAMKDQVEHSHRCKLEPLTLSKFDASKRSPKVYPNGIKTETTSLRSDNDEESRNFLKARRTGMFFILFSHWLSVT